MDKTLKIKHYRIFIWWKRGFQFAILRITPNRYSVFFAIGLFWQRPGYILNNPKHIDALYFLFDVFDLNVKEGQPVRGLYQLYEKSTFISP